MEQVAGTTHSALSTHAQPERPVEKERELREQLVETRRSTRSWKLPILLPSGEEERTLISFRPTPMGTRQVRIRRLAPLARVLEERRMASTASLVRFCCVGSTATAGLSSNEQRTAAVLSPGRKPRMSTSEFHWLAATATSTTSISLGISVTMSGGLAGVDPTSASADASFGLKLGESGSKERWLALRVVVSVREATTTPKKLSVASVSQEGSEQRQTPVPLIPSLQEERSGQSQARHPAPYRPTLHSKQPTPSNPSAHEQIPLPAIPSAQTSTPMQLQGSQLGP